MYWPWSFGIWDTCCNKLWHSFKFQGFPGTCHAINCNWLDVSVFDPEEQILIVCNLIELLEVLLTLIIMLCTMAEFIMLVLLSEEGTYLSSVWLDPFLWIKMEEMHTYKDFSMTVEENLVHNCLDLDARSCTSGVEDLDVKQLDLPVSIVWFL